MVDRADFECRAAEEMQVRGEIDGLAWGRLDLTPETYRALAAWALDAVEPLIRADEREQVFNLVIDQHGSAFIHPDLLPQWENWLSKIRADERKQIVTSLRRNRPQRPVTEYSQGYRDGITDTITQIEKEAGRG